MSKKPVPRRPENPAAYVPITNPDPWLSLRNAAEYANVSERTIRRHITDGGLTATRLAGGRVIRVRLSDLERWMKGNAS